MGRGIRIQNEMRREVMEEDVNNVQEPLIGEYKGNPVITLNPGDRYPFSFGLTKAKLILQHLDKIKEFIKQYEKNE